MNDVKENDGVVIDVTPEREPQPAPSAESRSHDTPPTPPEPEPRRAGLGVVLGTLAIVLLAVSLLFGYRYWSGLKQSLAEMNARLSETVSAQAQLSSAINQADATVRAQKQLLESRENEVSQTLSNQLLAIERQNRALAQNEQRRADEKRDMNEREQLFRAALDEVHQRIGGSGDDWKLAETAYLMRIAGHRLHLERDLATARLALELADRRLGDINDPAWDKVREHLQLDIQALSTVEAPDYDALDLRLNELVTQIDQLPLAGPNQPAAQTSHRPGEGIPAVQPFAPNPPQEGSRIENLWGDFTSGLKNAVRIKRNTHPEKALLSTEHALFARQNAKFHLEAARLGATRQDVDLYQNGLKATGDWITQYFDTADAKARSLLNQLDELREIDVRPELPDISHSLHDLQASIEAIEGQSDAASAAADGPAQESSQ